MNQGKIPVRYAKALISEAEEQGVMDLIRMDMENLLAILKNVPDLGQLLESPIIGNAKKLEVLKAIFEGKVQPLTLSFFRLALENNREEYLPGMARMYIDFYKKARGIRIAKLKTTVPVDKETKDSLIRMIRKLFNAEIELHEETDPDLIGGFILQVENQQLDGSVAGQLKQIKRKIMG